MKPVKKVRRYAGASKSYACSALQSSHAFDLTAAKTLSLWQIASMKRGTLKCLEKKIAFISYSKAKCLTMTIIYYIVVVLYLVLH